MLFAALTAICIMHIAHSELFVTLVWCLAFMPFDKHVRIALNLNKLFSHIDRASPENSVCQSTSDAYDAHTFARRTTLLQYNVGDFPASTLGKWCVFVLVRWLVRPVKVAVGNTSHRASQVICHTSFVKLRSDQIIIDHCARPESGRKVGVIRVRSPNSICTYDVLSHIITHSTSPCVELCARSTIYMEIDVQQTGRRARSFAHRRRFA